MLNREVTTLFDAGDWSAPLGTRSWCIAVRNEARSALVNARSTREQVQALVSALKEDNRFQQLADNKGNRFLTWDAFCECPQPHGFGMTADEVQALIDSKPAQELARDESVTALPHNGEIGKGRNSPDNVRANGHGNDATYLVRRLKRDAEDEQAPNHQQAKEALRKLRAGELKSARAAAIQAGIVKVPTPLETAQRAYLKLSTKEREKFLDWIGNQNDGEI